MKKTELSFTLIELLIVIAIIAIVAGAVLVAINPAKRLAEAQDSQRWSEVKSFSTAISTYSVDNRGQIPRCGGASGYDLPADGYWRWIGDNGNGGANYTDTSVGAPGEYCQSAWLMDDDVSDKYYTDSIEVKSETWANYEFNAILPVDTYNIVIGFNNDFCCGGTVCDCGIPPCPEVCTSCPVCCDTDPNCNPLCSGCWDNSYDINLSIDSIVITPPSNPQFILEGENDVIWESRDEAGGPRPGPPAHWQSWANQFIKFDDMVFSESGNYNFNIRAKADTELGLGAYLEFIVISQAVETIDDICGGNDGIINYPQWTSFNPAPLFGALDFNGIGDVLKVGTFDVSGNALTIMGSFKATGFRDNIYYNDPRIISKAIDTASLNNQYWTLGFEALDGLEMQSKARLSFRLKTGGITKELATNNHIIGTNEWMHTAGVYDGSQMHLYLDGQEVASTAKAGSLNEDGLAEVHIGSSPPSSYLKPFYGTLDEVAVFGRALSADELKEISIYGLKGERPFCDLTSDLFPYLVAQPADPTNGSISPGNSGYMVKRDPSGVITIKAPFVSDFADQEIIVSQ